MTLTQDDLQATSWQDDRVVLGAVPVPQGDLDESGPGWTARSRLTVDGVVVGACTVDAADWAAATLPVVPDRLTRAASVAPMDHGAEIES